MGNYKKLIAKLWLGILLGVIGTLFTISFINNPSIVIANIAILGFILLTAWALITVMGD